jgi:ribonuclease HI
VAANKHLQRGRTIHAFGDGATWDKEGITGWGIQLQDTGGNIIGEEYGRTPGVQQNDGSETYAILQSLLNAHTADDMELYCDNQGCVSMWERTSPQQNKITKVKGKRGNYAAMWNRIDGLRRERADKGSSTVMNWIQSHVQDEGKRTSTSSNMLCACRKASGNQEECTRPTEAHHWLHEGNDEADRLAKLSKDLEPITDLTELLKGEEAYVLGTGNEIAQGAYRAWIQTKLNNEYVETSKSIGLSKLKAAKGEAQQTMAVNLLNRVIYSDVSKVRVNYFFLE